MLVVLVLVMLAAANRHRHDDDGNDDDCDCNGNGDILLLSYFLLWLPAKTSQVEWPSENMRQLSHGQILPTNIFAMHPSREPYKHTQLANPGQTTC